MTDCIDQGRAQFVFGAKAALRISSRTPPAEQGRLDAALGDLYTLIRQDMFDAAYDSLQLIDPLIPDYAIKQYRQFIPRIVANARHNLLGDFYYFPRQRVDPYLMWRDQADNPRPGTDTDALGFRRTWTGTGVPLDFAAFREGAGQKAVLLSNSAGFGVGLRSDQTLASQFNALQDRVVMFNLSITSSSLYQSRLALQMFAPEAVQQVVILEGATTTIYHFLYPEWDFPGVPMFGDIRYFDRRTKGAGRGSSHAIDGFEGNFATFRGDFEARYDRLIDMFRRSLQGIAVTSRQKGASTPVFVLQPLFGWIDKPFSDWETFIWRVSERYRETYFQATIAPDMKALYPRLTADLSEACSRLEIDYVDCNRRPEFLTQRTVFLETNHMSADATGRLAALVWSRLTAQASTAATTVADGP